MSDTVLEISNLKKDFTNKRRNVSVLRDITFQIKRGLFYSIEGDSGSGKSTLLSILAGLRKPDAGKVVFFKDDEEIDITLKEDEYLSDLRRHDIAYISQFQDVIPGLTVEENIKLVDVFDGEKPSESRKETYEDILHELGIEELQNEYPEYLSGGELRRLIIARTIYAEPKVILADEPTNDLDEDNRRVILKLLKKLTEKGITVVTVTHESQVREYADECLELKNGVIGKCY